MRAETETHSGKALSESLAILEFRGELHGSRIGALRETELPGHAQAVTNSDGRITFALVISLRFVRCLGLAIERKRLGEAALRTGTFASLKDLIGRM